jgi:hypothetical protein
MKENDFNGWSNYATWRINLEMFDGADFNFRVTPEFLIEEAHESLSQGVDNPMTLSYALRFLDDVNWHEIANHLNTEE